MSQSAAFCRVQQDIHRRRASETTLENVRAIAALAASVWEREALDAERRDARQLRIRTAAEAAENQKAHQDAGADPALSENPDRGRADTGCSA
jgi:hypothetical protein